MHMRWAYDTWVTMLTMRELFDDYCTHVQYVRSSSVCTEVLAVGAPVPDASSRKATNSSFHHVHTGTRTCVTTERRGLVLGDESQRHFPLSISLLHLLWLLASSLPHESSKLPLR